MLFISIMAEYFDNPAYNTNRFKNYGITIVLDLINGMKTGNVFPFFIHALETEPPAIQPNAF